MGRKRFHDFDQHMAAINKEHITLHIFGTDYMIPATMPAIVPLELSRYDDGDPVPPRAMMKIARVLFGEKTLNEWQMHQEFSVDMLGEVIKETFKLINGEEEDDTPAAVSEDDMAGDSAKK